MSPELEGFNNLTHVSPGSSTSRGDLMNLGNNLQGASPMRRSSSQQLLSASTELMKIATYPALRCSLYCILFIKFVMQLALRSKVHNTPDGHCDNQERAWNSETTWHTIALGLSRHDAPCHCSKDTGNDVLSVQGHAKGKACWRVSQ